VVHCCVCSRNLKNEEAMARVGLQRHSKKEKKYIYIFILISPCFTPKLSINKKYSPKK